MSFLEHFQEPNQTLENIFNSIFWNVIKHLEIFSFPENIFPCIYFTLRIRFTSNQTQPKAQLSDKDIRLEIDWHKLEVHDDI